MKLIAGFAGAAAAFAVHVAAAQPTSTSVAEQLFEDGKKLAKAGHYEEALPKFVESNRIDPAHGGALFGAGRCYVQLKKPASARAAFRDVAALAHRLGDVEFEKQAEGEALALEPSIPKLTIDEDPATRALPGLSVTLDDTAIGAGALGTALPVDPGDHTVRATAPGKQAFAVTVSAPASAQNLPVRIPMLADASRQTEQPPREVNEPHFPTPLAIGGFVVGGVGLVGIAVGSYFGLHAKSLNDQSKANGNCDATNHCTPAGTTLRRDALRSGDISTGLFVAGGIALAGGVALIIAGVPRKSSPRATTQFVVPVAGRGGAGLLLGSTF